MAALEVSAVAGSDASLTRLPPVLPGGMSHLDPVAMIGFGAYAQVIEVHNELDEKRYALKVVEKEPLSVRGMLPQLAREFGVQRCLQHPRVAAAVNLAEDESHAYMLLELCMGGSVWQTTHTFPRSVVPEPLAARWLRDAAEGTAHLHGFGLIHRDLKLENLLLDADGGVRICDFGWCAFAEDDLSGMCGTPQLAPPEVSRGERHTEKMDIWALGACLVQLLTGHALSGPQDAWLPQTASPDARELAAALLAFDPDERATAEESLECRLLRDAPERAPPQLAAAAGAAAAAGPAEGLDDGRTQEELNSKPSPEGDLPPGSELLAGLREAAARLRARGCQGCAGWACPEPEAFSPGFTSLPPSPTRPPSPCFTPRARSEDCAADPAPCAPPSPCFALAPGRRPVAFMAEEGRPGVQPSPAGGQPPLEARSGPLGLMSTLQAGSAATPRVHCRPGRKFAAWRHCLEGTMTAAREVQTHARAAQESAQQAHVMAARALEWAHECHDAEAGGPPSQRGTAQGAHQQERRAGSDRLSRLLAARLTTRGEQAPC